MTEGPVHLAIGMFDGLHLGHQAVIEAAVHSARRTGGKAGVLSFWPHPSALFRGEDRSRMIMGPEAKLHVLAGLGVDFVLQQNFTREFAAITPPEFVALVKASLPGLSAIYVGDNWRFGAGRGGDVQSLNRLAAEAGVSVFSAPRVSYNGEAVSSSRIRECLRAGRLAEANAMLGYNYFAEGRTQGGRQLGRTIGFPTLNLAWEPELTPAYGVYAVRVAPRGGERWYPGIANYGLRPTVGEAKAPLLETHLLGECPFNYGSEITVEWLRFVRPERKFDSLQSLKKQMEADMLEVSSDFRLHGVG